MKSWLFHTVVCSPRHPLVYMSTVGAGACGCEGENLYLCKMWVYTLYVCWYIHICAKHKRVYLFWV